MIKVNIEITSSKLLSFAILIISAVYAFMFRDLTALSIGIPISGTVIVAKTGAQAYTKKHEG